MFYFNYEAVAKEDGISEQKMDRLKRLMRQEFPYDDMMYELHLLRPYSFCSFGYNTSASLLRPS